jgi:hypothetical protein
MMIGAILSVAPYLSHYVRHWSAGVKKEVKYGRNDTNRTQRGGDGS